MIWKDCYRFVYYCSFIGSIPRGTPSPARSDTPEKDEREVAPKVDQQKRIRQFRSEGWKLEPRVRFMSWAGKNIEPVNIDWVLQKLGFTHARLTIPKWAQRGAMDPMDVFISMLIDKMMATMQEDSNNWIDKKTSMVYLNSLRSSKRANDNRHSIRSLVI